jgi:hypothetical protein
MGRARWACGLELAGVVWMEVWEISPWTRGRGAWFEFGDARYVRTAPPRWTSAESYQKQTPLCRLSTPCFWWVEGLER